MICVLRRRLTLPRRGRNAHAIQPAGCVTQWAGWQGAAETDCFSASSTLLVKPRTLREGCNRHQASEPSSVIATAAHIVCIDRCFQGADTRLTCYSWKQKRTFSRRTRVSREEKQSKEENGCPKRRKRNQEKMFALLFYHIKPCF